MNACIVSVLILLIVGLIIFVVLIYNKFIQLENNINKSWANVDVLLKQRSDELPNLVNSVKGYMKHEREVLETLTKARTYLLNEDNLSKKAAANDLITETLKTIFAVAENYPDLKASDNFMQLQNRITGLENELADRREFYNDSVTIYNIRIQSFPDLIIAKMMKLTKTEWFKASEEDKQYVKVHL